MGKAVSKSDRKLKNATNPPQNPFYDRHLQRRTDNLSENERGGIDSRLGYSKRSIVQAEWKKMEQRENIYSKVTADDTEREQTDWPEVINVSLSMREVGMI